jgi:hypothetical protein
MVARHVLEVAAGRVEKQLAVGVALDQAERQQHFLAEALRPHDDVCDLAGDRVDERPLVTEP